MLVVILVGLSIIAYKTVFVSPDSNLAPANSFESEGVSYEKIESILREVENINFDTNILENEKFKSLKSIEIPLLSLPIGRENPFSPTRGSN